MTAPMTMSTGAEWSGCACSGRSYLRACLPAASSGCSCSRTSSSRPCSRPGTAFAHLTNLEVSAQGHEHPPSLVGLWELMASGGLPALAKLKVTLFEPEEGDEEVRSRVAPALEAVAGTLTHLCFDKSRHHEWSSNEVDVGYELGVAVGKLRRLKDLHLDLSEDGRVYQAFAQGLAASGGGHPLPLLWLVGVAEVTDNAELVASLLLPSVQVFVSLHEEGRRSALLTACALRQTGYKHSWAVVCESELDDAVEAIAQCMRGFVYHDWYDTIRRLP
jgi:hypothetical protein